MCLPKQPARQGMLERTEVIPDMMVFEPHGIHGSMQCCTFSLCCDGAVAGRIVL